MTTKANAIASMVNTLAKGLQAAKAAEKKPSKPKLVLSAEKQIELAREAGASANAMVNAKEAFTAAAKQLHEVGAKVGDARKCKLAQAFLAGRYPDGKGKDGKAVAAQTKKNALAAFRAAVEKGSAYNENAKRDEKKAAAKKGASHAAKTEAAAGEADAPAKKGATHVGADETATTFACTIARKGSAEKAAQTFRDLLNKMRNAEEYAMLCALLIDALDEFEGEAN